MTVRFGLIGDDPRAVADRAGAWLRVARRMDGVAREVEAQVSALAAAWPEGGAGASALAEASRCADATAEVARAHGLAARILTGLVDPLARWRRQVAELEQAWQLLHRAELERAAAVRTDLGDPHSSARIVQAERQLALVRARAGHPDTASVDTAYARLERHAREEVADVARRLDRLTAQGSAPVAGTGTGRSGVSRLRTELGLLATGARAQGRLAPQVARLVDSGVLPPEAAGWDAAALAAHVQAHPELAARLVARRPVAGADTAALVDPFVTGASVVSGGTVAPMVSFETFLATLGPAPQPTLTSVGDPGWPRRIAVRDAFEALSPSEQQLAALLWPGAVGNLSGAPFTARATANHVRVVAAVDEQRRRNAALTRDLLDAASVGEQSGTGSGADWTEVSNNEKHLAQLQRLAADPTRQIVWFDNADDGSIVELHGRLTAQTVGVGVFVPGTTAELGGHDTNARRSQSWVAASRGSVAMVTWMGGDLPDDIPTDAPFRDYADRLAPALASFSHDLRQEIDHSAAAGARVHGADGDRVGPALTVIGHSYGGAVIGTSEQYGLDADNVLHLESAGAGHDVANVDDLRPGRCDTRRYAITSAHDPIRLVQGLPVQPLPDIGHGADPADLDRVERLTGDDAADGHELRFWEAHGGVLEQGADGWKNVLSVLTDAAPVRQQP